MSEIDLRSQMSHEERADLYQWAMSLLCKEKGGEVFVKGENLEGGVLMHRVEEDGIRFRFVAMPDLNNKLN